MHAPTALGSFSYRQSISDASPLDCRALQCRDIAVLLDGGCALDTVKNLTKPQAANAANAVRLAQDAQQAPAGNDGGEDNDE
jgi:hypothetical protein